MLLMDFYKPLKEIGSNISKLYFRQLHKRAGYISSNKLYKMVTFQPIKPSKYKIKIKVLITKWYK